MCLACARNVRQSHICVVPILILSLLDNTVASFIVQELKTNPKLFVFS